MMSMHLADTPQSSWGIALFTLLTTQSRDSKLYKRLLAGSRVPWILMSAHCVMFGVVVTSFVACTPSPV